MSRGPSGARPGHGQPRLVTALEGTFGIVIPDEATGQLETADDVRRCVEPLTAAAATIPAPEGPHE
ncbi:hypothetical protein [Streptomyces formicae]|uniref:Acyl carrier protein n=1 Tax=Streptomyces formicae TaxID=1616117 RepID=A0ABY3WGJ7_9ACTN|nr:hypothetical protein [Streptomyces formicae]UNM11703.1 hypothetical protein J4032_09245 [Streptomyces formicae]